MTGFRQPVVVGLSGGLGNQMFQYAAGRSLAIRIGAPLALDLSWFGGQSTRQFALSPFRIEAKQHSQFSWLPPRKGNRIPTFPSLVATRYGRSSVA